MSSRIQDISSPFAYTSDMYDGVTVRSAGIPSASEDDFLRDIATSLQSWKKNGIRGVWFFISRSQAGLVPLLVKNGFEFHHAKDGECALMKWLKEDEPNSIPEYSHHNVGVGGFVVDENDRLLVVKEKYRLNDFWKLPGGYVNPGEDLSDAAVREVLEETGIETEFVSIITFRHAHKFLYGNSDLYFIAQLRPKTLDITKCPHEIQESRWMAIEEYINSPIVHENNKFFAKKYMENRSANISIKRINLPMRNKSNLIYFADMSPSEQPSDS